MGRSLSTLRSTALASPKPTKPKQLSHRIAAAIRDRILNWQYPPGYHLGERVLCDEFSASRIPVREALNSLLEQGLVERVPNQGCYVRQPDIQGVNQLYDLRLALELFVIERLARTGLAAEWVAKETSFWEPLARVASAGPLDGARFIQADEHFHLGLARQLENPYILDALSDLYERVRFVRMSVPTTAERIRTTAEEHLAILAAIARHDGEGARLALRLNIDSARSKVENALTQALAGSVWMHAGGGARRFSAG
jgi:DNA-binding GntR family transcriptional regulator